MKCKKQMIGASLLSLGLLTGGSFIGSSTASASPLKENTNNKIFEMTNISGWLKPGITSEYFLKKITEEYKNSEEAKIKADIMDSLEMFLENKFINPKNISNDVNEVKKRILSEYSGEYKHLINKVFEDFIAKHTN